MLLSDSNNVTVAVKYYDDSEDTPNVEKGNRMIIHVAQQYFYNYFYILRLGRNSGTDIIVVTKEDGKIYAVAECKNFSQFTRENKPQYISSKDFKRDMDNLNLFDKLPNVKKYYFISYESIINTEQRELLKFNNIELKVIGYEP